MNSRVIGASLLISGSCIGVGMLALPILTGMLGFYPALFTLFLACAFMTLSALLLVDVCSWFEGRVNFPTMVQETTGTVGRLIYWFLYLALFYALLVAYMTGSGNHVAGLLPVPDWLGTLFFVLVFGSLVYLGTYSVDLMNRFLMVGKIAAYIFLITLGFRFVSGSRLSYVNTDYLLTALPVLVISFGFHNMVPSVFSYLNRDKSQARLAIICGAAFSLVIYLLWLIVALGSLPERVISSSYIQDVDAAEAISRVYKSSGLALAARCLAFFAILTSFLAQSLSLAHFLGDSFKIKEKKRENPILIGAALIPPLICSVIYPQIFFKALNFAGGICAVVLFGVYPAIMVWRGKQSRLGNKPVLISIFGFAIFILIYQILQMS